MSVLSLERVGRRYGSPLRQVVALDDVSLTVEPGEMLAVMGPSGSGKSTLLLLASGLTRPTSGRVVLSGSDLGTLGEADLSLVLRRRVGFVFQNASLLAALTAAENVSLPLELDGMRPRSAISAARALLSSLGLDDVADRLPAQMSGGQQQRVAVARAVVGGRSLLLADEPTGALDSLSGESVMQLLRAQSDGGCAVVLVTHNIRHAAWADRILCLRAGRLIDDEQVTFPPLPRDRHPSTGHPLPDLPAHRRVPARQPHRGPDRALPTRPS